MKPAGAVPSKSIETARKWNKVLRKSCSSVVCLVQRTFHDQDSLVNAVVQYFLTLASDELTVTS